MKTYFNDGTITESANAPTPKGFTRCEVFAKQSVKLEQRENKSGLFRVTYGLQVRDGLTYAQACMELGSALMHSLACDGHINNEGK